ncbi:MAG: MotA/TolQ/ExbB proton channel family protein [Candidatus Thiodiazotropha sp. (ex Lucinoma annulata)]|nr:MotA/TolQ/ExbB proton channel family protein [Candidatus Thiodiazotropha sp. (ex Troendleina suluensis)]MCU7884848.1 MotA/TolQ/ExbB proton channel family protein [Candidatus Thiodiazotropha sp. (ex Lucinoma annulata)]
MRQPQTTYGLFLQWLLLFGLLAFITWLFWDQGLLQRVLISDPTHITLIILLLFLIATGHCATRSLFLSHEQNALGQIIESVATNPPGSGRNRCWADQIPNSTSLSGQLISGVVVKHDAHPNNQDKSDTQLLAQVMAEQARGQHEVGWFVCGLLVKLGLLGTVVGFVIMLAPVAELESFDLSDIQGLLQRMTTGMGVALNTTLMGLSCSMLLGMQYLMLDRAADRLVAEAIQFTETRLFKAIDQGE